MSFLTTSIVSSWRSKERKQSGIKNEVPLKGRSGNQRRGAEYDPA